MCLPRTGIAPPQALTTITIPPNIIITECLYEFKLCLCAQPIINFIIAALSQRVHLWCLYEEIQLATANRQPPTPAEMQLAAVAEAVRHKDTDWLGSRAQPMPTPGRE